MNNDELKTMKTEFDALLKSDKLYQNVQRSISKLIRHIPAELKAIAADDKVQKAHFLGRLEIIEENFKLYADNHEKAMVILTQKNEDEIKKYEKQRKAEINKISKHFNLLISHINTRRETLDSEYNEAIKEIETAYKRDLGSYQKVGQSARKLNQIVTLEIESEQQEALTGLKKIFENETKSKDQKKDALVLAYETDKKAIDEKQSLTTSTNNDVYLAIKTNYNLFSVTFNKKINELNKENQTALKTVKERYQAKRNPIEKSLTKLKEDYKTAIDRVKSSYQDELIKLNATFDEQKEKYELKKQRIIHESNEIISLLNSKLTAFKDSVNRENLEAERHIRGEMKSTEDEHQQVNLQKTLRTNLKNVNTELNKQIIRTNREINNKQKEFHYRLFNHDLAYLKTVNDWRLEKNLTTYKYKQSLAKIELNFNHNIAQSKSQLNLYETIYNHQQKLLELSLNHDLLSLETQLKIGSQIQERELNLLTNDQQEAINIAKQSHAKLDYEHQLALEELDFQQKKTELSYEYNKLTVGSNTQLELEKARSKRDFSLQEQDIRSEISKKIYERSIHNLSLENQLTLLALDLDMKSLLIKQDDQIFYINHKYRQLTHKRVAYIMKAKVKTQHRHSLLNVERLLDIDKALLLDAQYHIMQHMKYLLLLYHKRSELRQYIYDLYLLPSHPDVFKQSLLLAMRFDHEIDHTMQDYINIYATQLRDSFKAKIDDKKNYRYMMKYDETMKFYHAKIERIDREQKFAESEIQQIEQSYIKYQSDIDQNKAFIDQLMKINNQIKSGLLKSSSSYDIKENTKLIKNHQTKIIQLKDSMKRSDHLLNIKHREINNLAREQTSVQKAIESTTKKLTKEKSSESQFYLKYLVKLDKHFKVLSKKLSAYTNYSMSFYSELKTLVYVTNDALKDAFKKLSTHMSQFERQLVSVEQKLLQDTLNFYNQSCNLERIFSASFKHKSTHYLNEIADSTHTFDRDQNHAENLHSTMINKRKNAVIQEEKHQKDLLKLKKEKTAYTDLNDIKQLEDKLDAHLIHSESELGALNENQRAIAQQYYKEVEQKLEGHLKEHLKHVNFFKTRFTNTSSDLESNNQTLANKNQILLSRYTTQRLKALETMKNKMNHYDTQIDRHFTDIEKFIHTHEKELATTESRRKDEMKNIHNHLKRFVSQAESSQKNTLNKETTSLKRNLTFKLKALNLN